MRARIRGIHDRPVAATPIAVFDFETTGLNPGYNRVIEVSVIRLDPGRPPRLVLDTLVNPRRAVVATEIHGITDADVADVDHRSTPKGLHNTAGGRAQRHPRERGPNRSTYPEGVAQARIAWCPRRVREMRTAIAPTNTEYWEALKTVVYDLQIDDEELAYMQSKRRSQPLIDDQVRMLHARAFSLVFGQFIEDERLDAKEARKLARLHECLRQLGWAPGE